MPMRRGSAGSGRLRASSNSPSAASFFFSCSKASCSGPKPMRLHVLADQLVLALGLVDADAAARHHVQAVLGLELQVAQRRAEHHALHLRAGVLQREVEVPRVPGAAVRDLAFDPDLREGFLDHAAQPCRELGHRQHGSPATGGRDGSRRTTVRDACGRCGGGVSVLAGRRRHRRPEAASRRRDGEPAARREPRLRRHARWHDLARWRRRDHVVIVEGQLAHGVVDALLLGELFEFGAADAEAFDGRGAAGRRIGGDEHAVQARVAARRLEPRRACRCGSARSRACRSMPMTPSCGPVMPTSVRQAVPLRAGCARRRSARGCGCRPRRSPAVEEPRQARSSRTWSRRGSRRTRSARPAARSARDLALGDAERIVERGQEHAAHQVEHADARAVGQRHQRRAAARRAGRIVGRPHQARLADR